MSIVKKNKGIIANSIALVMLLISTNIAYAISLNDIKGHWAEKEIQKFIDKGYINGYSEDNTFRPENPITRAEFVKVVNKVYGYELKTAIKFTDVDKSSWYYEEVEKAVRAGYVNGYEDNTFKPNNPITREEAAKIIATIKNKQDTDFDKLETYSDADSVSSWARPYVEGVLEAKYINGYAEDNTLRPGNNIKRAESVVILNRTLEEYKYTTEEELEVRNGPGMEYEVIGTLPLNTKVNVLEYIGDWAKIEYKDGVGYISKENLSDTEVEMEELPEGPKLPDNIDSPQDPGVTDPDQDKNQSGITIEKDKNDKGELTGIAVSAGYGIGYSVYIDGKWIYNSNGNGAYLDKNKPIEGIKMSFTTPHDELHLFYRTKIKGKGWQAWVKDGKVSGEVGNGNIIEEVQIRAIVSNETDSMVKETISINMDSGNTENKNKLTKEIGSRVAYKLRKQGYNIVETISANNQLNNSIDIAKLNEVDKYIGIQFDKCEEMLSGTYAHHNTILGSELISKGMTNDIASTYEFKNMGVKVTENDQLNLLNIPAIIINPFNVESIIDNNKFVKKGIDTYDLLADAIVKSITKQ